MTAICIFCNKEFKTIHGNPNKFCSRHCFYEERKSNCIKRFFENIEKTKFCWLWKGGIDNGGYGQYNFRENNIRKHVNSHRYSYMLHFGEIPKGMNILHKCDNRKCVNPEHLFIGTQNDNIQDAKKKNRLANGEKIASSKLKNTDIINIRKMSKTISQIELGKIFNVSRSAIHRIIKFNTWKHII